MRARVANVSPATLAVAGLALVGVVVALGLVPYDEYARNGSLAVEALIGVSLLAALAYLAWNSDPAWLITAAVVLWPFNSNWRYFGLPGGIAPDRMFLLAGFAALVLRAPAARDRPLIVRRPIHLLFAATVCWTIGSGIAAGTLTQSTSVFLILDRMIVPFVVFALAPIAFRTPHHRKVLVAALVGAGLYDALMTLFQAIGLDSLIFPRFILDPSVGFHLKFDTFRARGPFLEAGINGLGLYSYGVAATVAFVSWRGRWARLLAAAVVLLCGLGIFLTFTRAAWVAAVVATVVTLLAFRQLRPRLVPVVIAGVALVTVALFTVPSAQQHVSERRAAELSVWERKNVDSATLRMIEQRPLTGFGLGTFNHRQETYFRQPADYPLVADLRTGVHNVFLLLATELGLIGLTLFLLSFLTGVGSALRARVPPDAEPWRMGLLAVAVFWVINANFAPIGHVFADTIVFLWAGVVLGSALPEQGWALAWPRD